MTGHASRFRTVRARLFLISLATTGVAVLVSGALLAFIEFREQTDAFEKSLRIRASVIGSSLEAAIDFEDPVVAREVLAPLESDPNVSMAAAYTAGGDLLAHFPDAAAAPTRAPDFGTRQHGRMVTDVTMIGDAGEGRSGRLLLECDLQPLYDSLGQRVLVLIATLGASLVLAVWLGSRLQDRMTRPIHELVRTASRIKQNRDFSARAEDLGDGGELGVLIGAFNEMLDRVEQSNCELRAHRDVLEQRVAERTSLLEEAVDRAETASRAKTDFLANMSHEIRTPMTAILGYAELIMDPDHTEDERANACATIQRNGEHLMTIINDILDVTKIEAGQMTVELIPCSPLQIVGEVVSLLDRRAAEKGLALEIVERSPLPQSIRTDPTRLRQIVLNLVGNAVKFTDSGSVRIEAEVCRDDRGGDGGDMLRLRVVDTGIGLDPDEQALLFQPFSQADESVTRRFGGTGLGLTISRSLAKLLGGGIEVESEKGKGSTFTVSVATGPLDDPELDTVDDRRGDARSGYSLEGETRVLVVEDGPDNQRLIQFILRKAGVSVELADNGQVGLDLALERWQSGRPFDVILMDMQMPVLDGYRATAALRDAAYPHPIVALTAHALKVDEARCLAAGCDDYATKPIDRVQLVQKIAEWKSRGAEVEARRGRDANPA